MFDIRITVGKIDYEKTIASLFPAVLNKCRELKDPNLLLRLFLELEEDALTVLLDILERLSEHAKRELLYQFLNAYRNVMTVKFNEFLQNNTLGRNFSVQNLYIEQTGETLELIGKNVSIDYAGLLECEEVNSKINETVASFIGFGGVGKLFAQHAGNALKAAAGNMPEETEKLGLKLIQREDMREKIRNLAQEALQKKELAMELKSLSFVQVPDGDLIYAEVPDTIKITPELEAELIKALAGYISLHCIIN